jgi:metal-responsive CopG/Arc/MetJ family transcriptional regulator
MASNTRKKYTTGVSLEPDVIQYLDQLTTRMSLNRSWVLNAIVRDYILAAGDRPLKPLAQKEAIIKL